MPFSIACGQVGSRKALDATCIGYLGHPFVKEAPWAFTACLFLVVRWGSAIEIAGEWFSCPRENRRGWAADHQGWHAKAAGEVFGRPLQTRHYQLDGPRPPAVPSHTWSGFRLPIDSHGGAHPRPEEQSLCPLHPARKDPICAVQESVAGCLDGVVPD